MASKIGMSYRIEKAEARQTAAAAKIATVGVIEMPEPIPPTRDSILYGALREEWLADLLERVAALEPNPEPVVVIPPLDEEPAAQPRRRRATSD